MVQTYQKGTLVLMALFSQSSYASSIGTNPANPVIALLKMTLALALVLVLLWGFATLLKRIQSPSLQAKGGLKIISSFSLGQREKLLVMQVGEEQMLLGVTSSSISKLHVLPTPLNLENGDDTKSFKKTLNAALNREIST